MRFITELSLRWHNFWQRPDSIMTVEHVNREDELIRQLQSDLMHERSEKELYRNIIMTRLGLMPPEAVASDDRRETPDRRAIPRRKGIYEILGEMERQHALKAREANKKEGAKTNDEVVNT